MCRNVPKFTCISSDHNPHSPAGLHAKVPASFFIVPCSSFLVILNISCCMWCQHYKQPILFLCVTVRKWLLSPMSAEASVGSDAADSAPSDVSQPAFHSTEELRHRGLLGSKYVKLNVGGSLHYTTVQTLSKEDSLLRSICNGGTEVTIDSEGEWVLDWSHIVAVYCWRAASFSRISYFIVMAYLL